MKRRHTDGQQVPEKMLNVTHHQENANLNHNDIPPPTCQNGYRQEARRSLLDDSHQVWVKKCRQDSFKNKAFSSKIIRFTETILMHDTYHLVLGNNVAVTRHWRWWSSPERREKNTPIFEKFTHMGPSLLGLRPPLPYPSSLNSMFQYLKNSPQFLTLWPIVHPKA